MIFEMPFHLRITHRDPRRRMSDTLELDKSEEWVAEQVASPRERGEAMFVGGKVVEWADVDEIHITFTDQTASELLPGIRAARARSGVISTIDDEWYVAYEGQDVTSNFLTGPPGVAQRRSIETDAVAKDPAVVMVVHGRDAEANRALFDWLRSIALKPREFTQLVDATKEGSPFIGRVLEQAFQEAQAVVVLITPDEQTRLRSEFDGEGSWAFQARPNVWLEAGMALASHEPRTVLVVLGNQALPSDLAGRHYVRLTGAASLRDLANRLRNANCPVDDAGEHWLDFERFPQRDHVALQPAAEATGGRTGRTFRHAVLQITEELNTPVAFCRKAAPLSSSCTPELASARWEEHRAELIDAPELHRTVRMAYRAIDAVNRSVRRGMTYSDGRPTTQYSGGKEAIEAIDNALQALEGAVA